MKYLGIDFGEKRVGIATSDETGKLAFPYSVILNNKRLIDVMGEIIKTEKVTAIVMGDSTNFAGEPNKIMPKIEKLKEALEDNFKLKVYFESEFLTSVQAERLQGKNKMHDASAAALILQSYLDRKVKE